MAKSAEIVLFVASNLTTLVLGGVLTAVSAAAAHRSNDNTFGIAALGFGLVTAGSVVEATYELGIRQSFDLGTSELLILHTVEGVLITVGMAALFLSVKRY